MYLPQLATIIASITAFTLMSMKLVIGMMSGSVSVLSSAIDSLLDLFVSLFNLVAVKTAQKPADKKFNYGRGKSEAIASFVEGGVIAISGVYIFVLSSKKIFTSESLELLGPAMSVMIVSIIVTFLLVVFLQHIAKKTDNLVVEADALHYKTDLYTNIGILGALVVIQYTGWYLIDGIIGVIISGYILYSAFGIIKKSIHILMDVALRKEQVQEIQEIISHEVQVKGFHFLKTRKSGSTKFVQAHIVFKNPHITLIDAHEIAEHLECQIVALDPSYEWVIDFHLDPFDDSHLDAGNRRCHLPKYSKN